MELKWERGLSRQGKKYGQTGKEKEAEEEEEEDGRKLRYVQSWCFSNAISSLSLVLCNSRSCSA